MDPRPILESEEEPSLAVQVKSIQARLDRLDQLDRSGEPPDEDGSALCAELRRLLGRTLHALSRGELRRPAQVAEALEPLEWFVEKHLPDPDLSIESLARELFSVMETLRLAADAADLPAFEAGIRDKSLSATHRAVLQVLLDASVARSGHLRCAEVKRRSGLEVSEQRVGQVLRELYERRLVIRTPWPAQGGEMVPFYTLTDEGIGVCERVGLVLRREERHDTPFRSSLQIRQSSEPPPGRLPIVAFASSHGGVGTSLAAAHVALFVQARSQSHQEKILVIDTDLESRDLLRMSGSERPGAASPSRGFFGLLLDHHQGKLGHRNGLSLALRAATREVYSSNSNARIFSLPAGDLSPQDRDLARKCLRDEVLLLQSQGARAGASSFVLELRRVLASELDVVLVDTPPLVRDPFPAYLGSVLLADALAVFVRPWNESGDQLRSLHEAFLARDPLSRGRSLASVLTVLARLDTASEEAAVDWYRGDLALTALEGLPPSQAPQPMPIRMYENGSLARGALLPNLPAQERPNSALFLAYDRLAHWVSTIGKLPHLSMVLDLVYTLVSKSATEDDRIIARGTLANLRVEWRPQLVGLLKRHFADELAAPIDGILESMTRTHAVMKRSSHHVPHAPKSDTTPPPGTVS